MKTKYNVNSYLWLWKCICPTWDSLHVRATVNPSISTYFICSIFGSFVKYTIGNHSKAKLFILAFLRISHRDSKLLNTYLNNEADGAQGSEMTSLGTLSPSLRPKPNLFH